VATSSTEDADWFSKNYKKYWDALKED